MTYNSNETTSKRHDGHAARDALQQDILDRREGEPQVRSEQLEDAEPHEARGHGHDGHPPRL